MPRSARRAWCRLPVQRRRRLPGPAAGPAAAPAGDAATRVHTCGVLLRTATARSIMPPRPSKLMVSPSRSTTRKLVGEIATSVIAPPFRREGSNVSWSPFSANEIADAGVFVAIAADVRLERRAIDGHAGGRRRGRHRGQLLLDQREDLRVVGLLGAGERVADLSPGQFARRERRRDDRHAAALNRLGQDCRRALRAALEQQRHHRRMVVHHRQVDRAHLVEGVLRVDVGAAGNQQLDQLDVAPVCGEGQRGGAVSGLRVDVGPLVERGRDARDVASARRRPELFGQRCGGGLLRGGCLSRCSGRRQGQCEPDERDR